MPRTESGHFLVSSPEEWAAVSTASWIEVVEFLASLGPTTASELAERTGRTRQNTYYHLRKLEGLGLVEVVDRRPGVRRPEAVFALVTTDIRLDFDLQRDHNVEPFRKAFAAIFQRAARAFSDAVDRRQLESDRNERRWVTFLDIGRLADEEIREVRELLGRVEEIVVRSRQRRGQPGEEFWSICASMVPLERGQRDASE